MLLLAVETAVEAVAAAEPVAYSALFISMADHAAALGEAFETMGRTEDAARAWGRASNLDPGDVVAAVNASILARRLGRAAAAVDLGERAVAADPEDARAHAALGAARLEAGRR